MSAVFSPAAGLLSLEVVLPDDLPGLFAAADLGSGEARRLVEIVEQALAAIESASRRAPFLCARCSRHVRPRDEFSLAFASSASTDNYLTFPVCKGCAEAREAVRGVAMTALRQIWPDARPVTVHTEGGRA